MDDRDIIATLKGDLGKELAIIDLYQKYVTQISDPTARALFLQLINESMGHADAFRRMLYKKTIGSELTQAGLSEVALANLIFFGMKEEREIRKVYEAQLPSIKDADYAALLRNIIEDEKRHELMLQAAFDRLKTASEASP